MIEWDDDEEWTFGEDENGRLYRIWRDREIPLIFDIPYYAIYISCLLEGKPPIYINGILGMKSAKEWCGWFKERVLI